MEETKEKKNVHPLLEFLEDVESIRIKFWDEEESQSLLKFLQMVDEGYVPNCGEIECLGKIDGWGVRNTDRLPESIRELKNLTELDVIGTQLSALPESIGELKNLTYLDVRGTGLRALPESIVELKNLTELDVSGTQLRALPESIGELKNLTYLDVRGTQLRALPESIVELKNLTELFVGHTQLRALPESIGELKNLTKLNVSRTQLRALPESIVELKNLTELNVRGTQLRALPESIVELKNLTELNVSGTQLRALPESIVELKNLTELDVSGTQLRALPESIGKLKNLTYLDVSDTQLSALPESIGELKNLTWLDVSGTQLSALPESIGKLSQLEYFDVSNTKVEKKDLLCIIKFKKLNKIGLRGLCLHHIPQELIELNLPFDFNKDGYMLDDGIYLKGTTLTTQPISLFAQPRELIEAYYTEEKVRISEAKVIFLGYGGAGKTYTIKRMMNNGEQGEYETEPTPGVDIQPYATQYGEKNLDILFWDFGGQEIMHSMHRCFLTGRTCYVVIVDNRNEGNMTEQAEYWLRNIRSFAPDCPVILAINRMEGVTDNGINGRKLKEDFPKLVGDPIFYSAKTDSKEAFNRLTDAICQQALLLDSYGMEFPASWAAIRREIEKCSAEQYYMDQQKYYNICEENGLQDSEIRKWLLAWFNDLGVCFSYHLDAKQEELQEYQLLNTKWLTNALYIIINTCRGLGSRGVITHESIRNQLNNRSLDEKYRVFKEFVEYKDFECEYILQIMRKFRLSYQLAEAREFIPALCDAEPPNQVHPLKYHEKLSYEIEYEYLPDTAIHRLMILCYEQLNLNKIWNRGFRIDDAINNMAAVVEMMNSEILRIDVYTISGNEKPWKVLAYLRGHILSINQDLNIKASDYVIVEDYTLGKIRHANISVEFLLNAKNSGIHELCREATEDHSVLKVQVDEILGTVFGDETIRQAEEKSKEQGIELNVALIQHMEHMADDVSAIKKQLNHVVKSNQVIADYAAVTAYSTKKTSESTREIAEYSKSSEEKLETIIEQNDTMIQNQELALELIQRLKQENSLDLQNLAEQMQQAVNQKKSPWEKFREYLGDGANLLTIISSIAPFINNLLQVPEIQMLPEQILIAMRAMGAL